MKFSKGFGLGFALLLLASGALVAQDIPLHNWTVPPYTQSSHSGGITTMNDVTFAHPFVGIAPCRVADTRGGAPITGGIFANSQERTWDVTGICGIPDGVAAISVAFSVVSAPGIPNGSFLLSWPTGSAPPSPPVAIITYGPNQIISGAAIIVLGPGEQVEINVSGSTHVIMDVNGYFAPVSNNTGTPFEWQTSNTGTFGAGIFVNTNAGTGQTFGLVARANSSGTGTAGVFGRAFETAGTIFGGRFQTDSSSFAAAGVKGVGGFGDPLPTDDCSPCYNSGVLGANLARFGVTGMSRAGGAGAGGVGVFGVLLNSTAGSTAALASGYLGAEFGTDNGGQATAPWGVFAQGDSGTSGTKAFVEPHPTDASKVITYISLEGAEAGTYFRGKGRFERGVATIAVPEDFRMVTASEGLSIQVTPIGEMATVAVQSIGLDRIVVRGSRNVEFFYTVNGVRATFKDRQPIRNGGEFMPEKASATMPEYLSEGQKRLLIQNGTYRPDGTVNMETAHTLGWDKIWQARARPEPRPAADTP